jgi:hypothetical protein
MIEQDKGRNLQETFVTSTLSSFGFLIKDHGFSVHDTKTSSIKYSKSLLVITISWNSYAYEIDVDFRREDNRETYSLYEVVMALAPSEEWQIRCSGADSAKMQRCLDQLSLLCRRHLQSVLAMDEATFKKIAESANENRRQYTLKAQYGAIKDSANLAWEKKDWERARKLYEKAKPALSTSEKRRLNFLRKKNAE